MLYTYGRVWRVIWTDGRELPKDPDPHWYGYSVGKWTDDYTFVVQTNVTSAKNHPVNCGSRWERTAADNWQLLGT